MFLSSSPSQMLRKFLGRKPNTDDRNRKRDKAGNGLLAPWPTEWLPEGTAVGNTADGPSLLPLRSLPRFGSPARRGGQ